MNKYLMFHDKTIFYAKTEQDAVKYFERLDAQTRNRVKAYRLNIEIDMFEIAKLTR